ncbi:MAG: methyltransferase domain-containing protein [Halieaceae bacterium]|jgi:23S rRNA (guanine745-N1)-methyltransferase|nr:methyltransferase domain-containing protein [Halieaceae bacterium]
MWACPHCQLALLASPDGASLVCANGHSFDRAREGYVNLLPANRKRSPEPGDNSQMVAARRRVHDAQAYRPLADALAAELAGLPLLGSVLDLGCGEGYYTNALARALPGTGLYGIDISRTAVRLAAKRCAGAEFAVASALRLPLPDAALDAVIRVFAPSQDPEVARVLNPGGYYLEVCPAPRHLWQLRAMLYDKPRESPAARSELAGMQLLRRRVVQYELNPAPDLVTDIVAMSPFSQRGHREKRERLQGAPPPVLSMGFSLHLFQCTPDVPGR